MASSYNLAIGSSSGVSDQTNSVMPSAKIDHTSSPPTYACAHLIVCKSQTSNLRCSLVDRGANGGILGDDARVLRTHDRHVDVTGIDNHELNGLKIVDGAAKVSTDRGKAILILNQYAYHGINRTVHSAGQIEFYQNVVDDRSAKIGGRQCIRTLEGYIIPLEIRHGLPYLPMEPPTDKELEELPHVILTSTQVWNPTILDNSILDQEDWVSKYQDIAGRPIDRPFDDFGNYMNREPESHVPDLPSTKRIACTPPRCF